MDILKHKVIANMHANGLVGIVRDKSEEEAMVRTRAIMDGGVTILEVSMSTPGALNIIETIAKEIKEKNNTIQELTDERARLESKKESAEREKQQITEKLWDEYEIYAKR